MEKTQRIFIIGPAGVGKSTCGSLLANKLNYNFVDQDTKFNERIGEIGNYIKENGYVDYCNQNSNLFYSLIDETLTSTIYALSSGFLLYEDIDQVFSKHSEDLEKLGTSILLLPSQSREESVKIVVKRVVARRAGIDSKKETSKIRERFLKYLRFGDIKIFSADSPSKIADQMKTEYLAFLTQKSGKTEYE